MICFTSESILSALNKSYQALLSILLPEGFFPENIIQDFPIRNQKVYTLHQAPTLGNQEYG